MSDRYYNVDDCMRKADQSWEMAGLASQDGDKTDAQRHLKIAQAWVERAREGGCFAKDAPK